MTKELDEIWAVVDEDVSAQTISVYAQAYREGFVGTPERYIREDLVPTWQPEETAPKDGTEILVKYHPPEYWYDIDYSIVVWDGQGWLGMCDGVPSIESQSVSHTEYHRPLFTHWKPVE